MKKNTKTSRRVTASKRLRDAKGRFVRSHIFEADPIWQTITPAARLRAAQVVRAADAAIAADEQRLADDAEAAYMAICQSRPSAPVAEYMAPRRAEYGWAALTILFLILLVGGCVALAH